MCRVKELVYRFFVSEFVVYKWGRDEGWDRGWGRGGIKGFVELIRYACGCDSCRFEK